MEKEGKPMRTEGRRDEREKMIWAGTEPKSGERRIAEGIERGRQREEDCRKEAGGEREREIQGKKIIV